MSGARRDSCVVAVVSSCTSLGMQRASFESTAGNRVHAAQRNATRGVGSKACAVNACDRWMRRVRSPISRTLILLQVEYPAPLQYAQPRLSVCAAAPGALHAFYDVLYTRVYSTAAQATGHDGKEAVRGLQSAGAATEPSQLPARLNCNGGRATPWIYLLTYTRCSVYAAVQDQRTQQQQRCRAARCS